MILFDHLTVIAPNLQEGVEHVEDCLGVRMGAGGYHPEMGTHNRLMRFGNYFIEVIALKHLPVSGRRPWFGLGDQRRVQIDWEAGRRLKGWVARTVEINGLLSLYGFLLGERVEVSRGSLTWSFSVPVTGDLPGDGAIPSVIQWPPQKDPLSTMEDSGLVMTSFELEHPHPRKVRKTYALLEATGSPNVLQGQDIKYTAYFQTPKGIRKLT